MRISASRVPGGFTRINLLVVIAILANLAGMLLPARAAEEGAFVFQVNGTEVIVTGYACVAGVGAVVVPDRLGRRPVTSIRANAFSGYTNSTSVTIPNNVTNIGERAFSDCTSLTAFAGR